MVAVTQVTLCLRPTVGPLVTDVTLSPVIGVRARDTSFNRTSVTSVTIAVEGVGIAPAPAASDRRFVPVDWPVFDTVSVTARRKSLGDNADLPVRKRACRDSNSCSRFGKHLQGRVL